MRTGIFICLLFCLPITHVYSQELIYTSIGVNEGLSDPLVFRIYSDKEGFLWFSTDNGLDKFDGTNIINYNTQNGLGRNIILPVVEDKSGMLWVGTYGGGLCYKKGERFYEYIFNTDIKPRSITALLFDSYNNGWVYDNQLYSLFKFNLKTKKSEIFNLQNGIFISMLEIEPGKILIAGSSGLYLVFNNKIHKNTEFDISPAYCIEKTDKGIIFIGTDAGILKIDNNQKVLIQHPVFENIQVSVIKAVNDSILWAGSEPNGKAILFNYSKHCKHPVLAIVNDINVIDIEKDIEGNFWFSTRQGVRCYYKMTDYFFSSASGLPSGDIGTISETLNGSILVSSKNNQDLTIIDNNNPGSLKMGGLRPGENIMYSAKIGNEFLFTLSSGRMVFFDPISGESRSFYQEIYFGRYLYQSNSGNIWLAQRTGAIGKVTGEGKINLHDYFELKNTRILSLCEFDNNMLIGTDSGVYVLDIYKNKIVFNLNEKNGLAGNWVIAIQADSLKNIWFGTSSGLTRYDYNSKKLITYTVKDGLNHNDCQSLCLDRNNKLWVGTSNGLNFFDYESETFYNYQSRLKNKAVKVLYPDTHGNLWVGTSEGLIKISLIKNINTIAPFVYFNHFKVNNNEYADISNRQFLHYENNISIGFSSIFFSDPENSTYYYRINKGKWNPTKNKSIELAHLRPRSYMLEVKVKNSYGIESSNIATVKFRIKPPFWTTWWFVLLEAFTVIGIIIFVIRRRITKVRKIEREKLITHKKVLDLEQKALSALINPHFIFNALASVQHYITVNDKDAAYNFLSKFSKLIRITLENVYKSKNSIEEEVERLELYMSIEKLRFKEKFDYEIIVNENISAYDTEIPAMLIQPFIENSIWHGIMLKKDKGTVKLIFEALGDDYIKVRIEDDGIGINKAKEMKKDNPLGVKKESLALKITIERLNLMAKLSGNKASVNIYDRREKGEDIDGTVVEIIIPVNYIPG